MASSRRKAQRPTAAGPVPVQVLLGGRWLTAKAHAIRAGRLGSQVLIDCHGYLVWINAARVRRPSTPARQPHDLPDQPTAQPKPGEATRAAPDLASGTDGSEPPQKR
ncbi:hypothetical protein ACGFIF_38145 [Kribbella sp. NPDC049174]|uniref:hypothetical protein n=1 Tax=Kribbella sp. NPDC049174 TaxID=3364112 RepID=UPI00372322AF